MRKQAEGELPENGSLRLWGGAEAVPQRNAVPPHPYFLS